MYKLYLKGNYVFLEILATGQKLTGFAKEVKIIPNSKQRTVYTILNIHGWSEATPLTLIDLQKENGVAYTESEFETFYTESTGNFSSASGGSDAELDAIALALLGKLPKGAYAGTADDLKAEIVAMGTSVKGDKITPSTTPAGTGVGAWLITEAGTYIGGNVLPVNSLGFLLRNASNAYSVTYTSLDLTNYQKKKIIATTPISYDLEIVNDFSLYIYTGATPAVNAPIYFTYGNSAIKNNGFLKKFKTKLRNHDNNRTVNFYIARYVSLGVYTIVYDSGAIPAPIDGINEYAPSSNTVEVQVGDLVGQRTVSTNTANGMYYYFTGSGEVFNNQAYYIGSVNIGSNYTLTYNDGAKNALHSIGAEVEPLSTIVTNYHGNLATGFAKLSTSKLVDIDVLPILNKTASVNLYNYRTDDVGIWLGSGGRDIQLGGWRTSKFIPVLPNERYFIGDVSGHQDYYTYLYNSLGEPLSPSFIQQTSDYITMPANCYFIKKLNNLSGVHLNHMIIHAPLGFIRPTSYIDYLPSYKIKGDLIDSSNNVVNPVPTKAKIGAMTLQPIVDDALNHIICYSQSLGLGWEAPQAYSTTTVPGTFMLGNRVHINRGNSNQGTTISPLIGTVADGATGETPLVSAIHHLKTLMDYKGRKGDIIATNAGEGGKSIEMLSKEHYYGVVNLYNTEFIKTIDSAKTYATSVSKNIVCPAIIWMQGEYNYTGLGGQGLTADTDATTDKNTYKSLLITLKNNMQADVMAKYNQTKKPIFKMYQVAGSYINNKTLSINMAMIELSEENDDIVLMNPTYQTPDYSNGHLTSNGYRWYGELIGKTLGDVLVDNNRFMPLKPIKFEKNTGYIRIWLYVPSPPLVKDTYTISASVNNGFTLYIDNVISPITNVLLGNSYIDIYTSSSLAGVVEISYAGSPVTGQGNIRDSDDYKSLNLYVNDSGLTAQPSYQPKDVDNTTLYGKRYPLKNWLSNFYKLIG